VCQTRRGRVISYAETAALTDAAEQNFPQHNFQHIPDPVHSPAYAPMQRRPALVGYFLASGYMTRQSKQETAKRLRDRLSSAHQAYMDALSRLDAIAMHPGQLPALDGLLRGQRADTETRITHRRYMDALQQRTDFALSGAIPEANATFRHYPRPVWSSDLLHSSAVAPKAYTDGGD
jgi:hypothetical protein